MKKLFLLSLFALGLVQASNASEADYKYPDLVKRVQSCEAILQEFTEHPDTQVPPQIWARARAVVILNQFKAGFIFGVRDGYGVIMVRHSDNTWSIPVLINAGETSLGLQLGAKSIESILIFTDDQTPKLLFRSRFNVGVDAKAVAGPKVAEAEKFTKESFTNSNPILVYSKSKGLYAGATIKVGALQRNDDENYVLYNTHYAMPELLYSNWVNAPEDVKPIIGIITNFANGTNK